MARSRKRNSNQEVRRFVKLDKNLTQSIAYKKLSGSESKIFHILLSQYNGSNNGKLAIPYNQAGEYELSRQTLSNSLNLLEAKGFNGRIAAPASKSKEMFWVCSSTLAKGLKELEQSGFITITPAGGRNPRFVLLVDYD